MNADLRMRAPHLVRRGLVGALFISGLLVAAVPAATQDEDPPLPLRKVDEEKRPAKRDEKDPAGAILRLSTALDRLRENYRGLVIYYDGGPTYKSTPQDLPALWKACTDDHSTRKILEKLLVAHLDEEDLTESYPEPKKKKSATKPPDPPAARDEAAARVLGVTSGYPALLLVDFRERVVKRYTSENVPSRTMLKRHLSTLYKTNLKAAAIARKVEKIIEASRYAYKLRDTRNAVLKILPYLEKKQTRRLDPVTLEKLRGVEESYRTEARSHFKVVDSLDKQKKYAKAILKLEEIRNDFPFLDVIKKANQRRGEIYRKAQIGI